MKSMIVKSAVASALALACANAMALTPAEIQAGGVVPVYVAGATATDNVLENLAKLETGGLCKKGTTDIYYQRNAAGSIRSRALTCVADFTSGAFITSGTTKIALFKESAGGSANGIHDVAQNLPRAFIDLLGTDGSGAGSNFASACSTVTSSPSTLPTGSPTAGTFRTRDCGYDDPSDTASTVTVTSRVATAGISDVDPATFVGTGGVTSADAAALTRKRSSVAVTFNPIVSLELFRALQDAQGLISSGGAEDTTSIGKLPSLPKSVLRGVFNGLNILSATEIYTGGVQLSSKTTSSSEDIYICRRGDTSGTMTSFKLELLNQGCTKNASNTFVKPDALGCEATGCGWSAGTYGAHFVFAGSGSGDVRSCMDYHSGQNHLALGVASTESKPNSSDNRWRYIKVDGAAPTLKETMEGSYDFFTQNTMNDKYPATVSSGAQAIWDRAYAIIGSAAALVPLNSSWKDAAAIGSTGTGDGDTGILDLPAAGNLPTFPVTGASVRVKPVNGQLRQNTNGSANNCNMPYMAYP